jgi:hypothetical protein
MDEDEFDFSDPELDDLPANTLLHLEENALRATQPQQQQQQQQQQHFQAAPESDYGLDDGDEVVNLDDDDDAGATHAYHAAAAASAHPQYTQAQQGYHHPHNGHNELYQDQMQVEEQPYRSQADPAQLLSRIKKVGCTLATHQWLR